MNFLPPALRRRLALLFISAGLSAFLALSFYSFPLADDWCFAGSARGGVFHAVAGWYKSWSGRYFSHLVNSLTPATLDRAGWYPLVPLSLLIGFGYALFQWFGLILAEGSGSREDRLLWTLGFCLVFLSTMPEHLSAFYWAAAAQTYTLGTILALVGLSLAWRVEARALHRAGSFACIVAAVGTNEALMSILAMATTADMAICLGSRSRRRWFAITLWLRACRDGGSDLCELDPYPVAPPLIFYTGITEDATHWRNRCVADALGLKSVVVRPGSAALAGIRSFARTPASVGLPGVRLEELERRSGFALEGYWGVGQHQGTRTMAAGRTLGVTAMFAQLPEGVMVFRDSRSRFLAFYRRNQWTGEPGVVDAAEIPALPAAAGMVPESCQGFDPSDVILAVDPGGASEGLAKLRGAWELDVGEQRIYERQLRGSERCRVHTSLQ